jgi:membrane protein DedA with SNARE-associated domain
VAYAIGFWGGRPLVERWGRYVLMGRHELALVDRFFDRWGNITVLVCRLLPLVRTFIALPAGVGRMPQWRFHIYTFLGSWPWCFGLAFAGMKLGEAWASDPRLRAAMHRLDVAVVAVLALGVGWYALRLARARAG